jgi:uncharacterized protein (DUF433 family)
MVATRTVVQSNPNVMSGTPVFAGTRVPVDALIDYLQGDDALAAFLEDFPTVTRDQANAALEIAREALKNSSARSAG